MSSKIAIVTGSNKGLGFQIVKGLCQKTSDKVYLTSRDVQRGRQACEKLKKNGLKPHFHQLDITNQESVLKFIDSIKENNEKVHIIINNAGILFLKDAKEPRIYQAEQTIHVNFTCLVNFTELMLPYIQNGGRIVNISSSSGHLSRIPSKDIRESFKSSSLTLEGLRELVNDYLEAVKLEKDVEVWGDSPYVVSKVAVNAYTFILDRRLKSNGILVNCIHPGYVISDMTRGVGTITPENAARWPVCLATETIRSGLYMWHDGTVVDWDGEDPRKWIDGKEI